MKKQYILISLILVLAAIWVWRIPHRPANEAIQQTDLTEANQSQASNQPPAPVPTVAANTSAAKVFVPSPGSNFTAWNEKRMEQMSNTSQSIQSEWRTPIEFYGVVEDESNNVIAGAQVDFDCNDLSATGTSFYHTQSSENGTFSINNITGKLLTVKIGKMGYYPCHPNGDNFYYAGQNQNFAADAGNPVVFHLRKMGTRTALIHFHKNFRVPRDGTPILVDLATGSLTQMSENAVKIEGVTHDTEKKEGWKYDWQCQVLVPGGGLQIYGDPFPFEAPQGNYITEDLIDMTVANNAHWTYDVQRNYYIHTAAGNFGRMVFGMVAGGDNFCVIDSYFNPSGSANLEPTQ